MTINLKYVVAIVLIGVAFLLGRNSIKPEVIETEIVRVDTITREVVKPIIQYKDTTIVRYLTKVETHTDTLNINTTDTIKVYVPISKYTFEEKGLYRAEISGYEVSLDKIDVFPKTIYQTKTIKNKPKFGLGVQVGYGICGEKLSPYVGIGLTYNLITF